MATIEKSPQSGLYEVYVSGIPVDLTEVEIKALFSTIGQVKKVLRIRHQKDSEEQFKHYCFIGYGTKEEADAALNAMDGYKIGLRRLTVKTAQHRKQDGYSTDGEDRRKPRQLANQDGYSTDGEDHWKPRQQAKQTSPAGAQSRQVSQASPDIKSPGSTCAKCDRTGALQCVQCKSVRYCSRDCQVQDWALHKKICLSIVKINEHPASSGASPVSSAVPGKFHRQNNSSRKSQSPEPNCTPRTSRQPAAASSHSQPTSGQPSTASSHSQPTSRQPAAASSHSQPTSRQPTNTSSHSQPTHKLKEDSQQVNAHTAEANKMTNGSFAGKKSMKAPKAMKDGANSSTTQLAATNEGAICKERTPAMKSVGSSLQAGQQVRVVLMESESPSQFWVQICDENLFAQIQALQEQLQAHYENPAHRVQAVPNEEPLVAAVFPDDSLWYRAEILRHKTDRYQVRYVDFGNVSVVSQVYVLAKNFYQMPIMSVNCGIAGIHSASKPWSAEAIEFFQKLVGNGVCEATVVECTPDLMLLNMLTSDGESICDKMVAAKLGSRLPLKNSSLRSSPAKPDSRDQLSECPDVKMATDLKKCTLTHGEEVKVVVADAPSPLDITLQALTRDQGLNAELKTKITEQLATHKGRYVPQRVNELILAKFSGDNEWYRAQVLNRDDPNAVQVVFVDFGNKDVVNAENMVSVSGSSLHELPVLGILAALHGVDGVAPGQVWNPDKLEPFMCLFNAIVKGKSGEKVLVELTKDNSETSVNHELLEAGLLLPAGIVTRLSDLPRLDIPLAPTILDCTVVTAPSSSDISLQIITAQVEQTFRSITEILSAGSVTGGYSPRRGEVVCSLYEGDWGRAEVLTAGPDYKLRYVDYGNVENVGTERIAKLFAGLEKFAPIAVQCSLTGVAPSLSLEAETFKANTMYKVKIDKKDDIYEAEIFDNEGNSVNAELTTEKSVPVLDPLPLQTAVTKAILHVTSLTEFYVAANIESMTMMMEKCAQEAQTVHPSPTQLAQGQLACCVIANELYRVKVLSVTGTHAKVHSIDYGFDENIPIQDVKSIPGTLLSVPPQVYKCSLAGITGPGDEDSVKTFADTVMNKSLRIVPTELQGDTMLVQLFLPAEGGESTLVNKIFEKGHGKQLTDLPVAPELPLQKAVERIVVHVESPREFYVVDSQQLGELIPMMLSLTTNAPPPTKPQTPGELVCVFTEGEWYRMSVDDIENNQVKLYSIDYAFHMTCHQDKIHALPANLLALPPIALRCCLAEVDSAVKFQDKIISDFTEIMLNQNVRLVCTERTAGSSVVKVYQTSDGTDIGRLIMPLIPETTQTCNTRRLAEHLPKAILPESGVGCVVYSQTPQKFYIQMENNKNQLADIWAKVALAASNIPPQEGFVPSLGELCLARHADEAWYRGVVVKHTTAGFEVNFIDFGDNAVVAGNLLRPLPKDLMAHAPLAYCCSLPGVFPSPDGPWSATAIHRFMELTENVPLTITRKKSNTSFYLVSLTDQQKGDIANVLLAERLAVHRHMDPVTASAVSSEGEMSVVEDENLRLKAENERLRKQMELLMAKKVSAAL